jgi:very-short-patch-repair endonuclease
MLRTNAKRMRSDMTEAELKLWNAIRASRLMGLKFRRQMPIGNYIVDFVCPTHRVIVELDGSHHADDDTVSSDAKRTEFLQNLGWQVVRFWNHDVLNDIDNVCQHICILCNERAVVHPL